MLPALEPSHPAVYIVVAKMESRESDLGGLTSDLGSKTSSPHRQPVVARIQRRVGFTIGGEGVDIRMIPIRFE